MLVYKESYKASYTDLTFSIDPECTYSHVYEHTKCGHKHKYVCSNCSGTPTSTSAWLIFVC